MRAFTQFREAVKPEDVRINIAAASTGPKLKAKESIEAKLNESHQLSPGTPADDMVSPEAAAHAFLDDDIDQLQIAQRASEGNLRVERVD